MVLRGELLRAQAVRLDELARHVASLEVAERVEDDLADHGVVGDHHRDVAEERLEVIRELGTTGVARVHGDEDVGGVDNPKLHTLEDEPVQLCRDRALNAQHLLRHHREHLELDAVELVEARPRARRRQTFEKLPHRLIVQAVRAVEHDALNRDSLGEVLRGLRLTRTRGSRGCPPEVQVNGAHQGAVAPVRQRRDDQSRRVTEVLKAVLRFSVDHANLQGVVLPKVAQLREPLEILRVVHAVLGHLNDDVPGVDVDGDQRRDGGALQLGELASYHVHDVRQLGVGLVPVRLEPALDDGVGDLLGPVHLRRPDDHLAGPVQDPLLAGLLRVRNNRLASHLQQGVLHDVLELEHPLLHRASLRRVDLLAQRDAFALHRHDRLHGDLLGELHLLDSLEAFLHERLHPERILPFRKNLEELVVGKEEEARERHLLGVQKVVEALLDDVQLPVGLLQIFQ